MNDPHSTELSDEVNIAWRDHVRRALEGDVRILQERCQQRQDETSPSRALGSCTRWAGGGCHGTIRRRKENKSNTSSAADESRRDGSFVINGRRKTRLGRSWQIWAM